MTLSANALRAALAQETSEVFLLLLTFDHPNLSQPIRVVNNSQDIVSRGDTFVAYPFEIELPSDLPDRPPRTRIKIDNVDRLLVDEIRTLATPPTIALEVILAGAPDVVEASWSGFTLQRAEYDALTISGDIAQEDVLNEPFPGDSYTPGLFPGLFP